MRRQNKILSLPQNSIVERRTPYKQVPPNRPCRHRPLYSAGGRKGYEMAYAYDCAAGSRFPALYYVCLWWGQGLYWRLVCVQGNRLQTKTIDIKNDEEREE